MNVKHWARAIARARGAVLALAFVAGCSDESSGGPGDGGADGSTGGAGAGGGKSGSGGSGAGNSSGGTTGGGSGGRAGGSSSGGKAPGGGGTGTGGIITRPPGEVVLGGPGCGFQNAAFCDTFDGPAAALGRAGELDSRYWAAGRAAPQFPSGNDVAMGIGPSQVPSGCRPGLPATVYSDRDTLICDGSAAVGTPHLLSIVGAQNYGQNSYRIRQPFDFRERTGKIVFDADGSVERLLGWISVEITEDPINAPSFSLSGADNDEGGIIPRRALEVQFQNPCEGLVTEPSVSVRVLQVYENYVDTTSEPDSPVCVPTKKGHLNHFEIEVSQTKVSVYATPFSQNGVDFPAKQLIYSRDVSLRFAVGYVHITTHNHATLKYSPNEEMDAWVAPWDNVGFDGPVLSNWREYEIPESLEAGQNAWNRDGPVKSIAYRLPEQESESAKFTFRGVDPSGAASALVSLSGWYLPGDEAPQYGLRYRWNGGTWHDRPLNAGESGILRGGGSQGLLGQVLETAVSELKAGDNVLELVAVNVPNPGFPHLAANVDLVLKTPE